MEAQKLINARINPWTWNNAVSNSYPNSVVYNKTEKCTFYGGFWYLFIVLCVLVGNKGKITLFRAIQRRYIPLKQSEGGFLEGRCSSLTALKGNTT